MFKFIKFAALASAGISTMVPTMASAQAGNRHAELFGARQAVLDIGLSPSGDQLVFVAPRGDDGEAAYVVDLVKGSKPLPVLANNEPSGDIYNCGFASEERIVCQIYFVEDDAGLLLGFTRSVVVSNDGKDLEMLTMTERTGALDRIQDGGSVVSWNVAGEPESILMTRQFVKESSVGTNIYSRREGLAVEKINLKTMKRRGVVSPMSTAMGYLADENGNVRVLVTRGKRDDLWTDSVSYSYRKLDENEWTLFENIGELRPFEIDSANNRVYASGKKDGFDALYTISLDGKETVELLLARSDADIDKLIRIGKKRRVIGAGYATERREIDFFDSELEKLARNLRKALPGDPIISIEDASEDESKLLLIASSDTDPGMIYRYDKNTKQLEQIMGLRDNLAQMPMGQMQSVLYPAADGTMIPAYLTLPPGSDGKNIPAIVMPHGGPSSRDEWGFDWLAQYFAQRGFAVLQPNFRGSAGYGDDWYLKNGFQSWRTSIGDVTDAGRWLVSEGIANPGQLGIVGWSYGGYAALQSQVLSDDLFKATVAIAPVTDLGLQRAVASRYTTARLVNDFIGDGPHLTEGSPLQNVGRISSPVMLVHGDIDLNVDVAHSRKMADALSDSGLTVEYTEFDATDHFINDRAKRTKMLRDADAFLRRHLNIR